MEPLKKKLTPERTVKILAKHGTTVTLEEAEILLKFIEEMGRLAIGHALEL
ncbi:MAG: hypothetical protein ACTHNW_01975 [Mucilaginibacter sp.]